MDHVVHHLIQRFRYLVDHSANLVILSIIVALPCYDPDIALASKVGSGELTVSLTGLVVVPCGLVVSVI
jgi:hypothetical protein